MKKNKKELCECGHEKYDHDSDDIGELGCVIEDCLCMEFNEVEDD